MASRSEPGVGDLVGPWGAERLDRHAAVNLVLVGEPAEQVAPPQLQVPRLWFSSDGRPSTCVGRSQAESAVRPPPVVLTDADAVFELAAADDQDFVEAFAADAADPALHWAFAFGACTECVNELDVLASDEGVRRAGTSHRGHRSGT